MLIVQVLRVGATVMSQLAEVGGGQHCGVIRRGYPNDNHIRLRLQTIRSGEERDKFRCTEVSLLLSMDYAECIAPRYLLSRYIQKSTSDLHVSHSLPYPQLSFGPHPIPQSS